MRRPLSLDVAELERLAGPGVKFDSAHIKDLVEIATVYRERFQEPIYPESLVDRQTDWEGFHNPRQADHEARKAFILEVGEIWRECGGISAGQYHDVTSEEHSGPLVLLLERLFQAVGGPVPSRSTIRHDLAAVATQLQRSKVRHPRA